MKKILTITLVAVAAIVASCTDNSNIDAPYDGEVRITSGINTRVVGTSWEPNDAIGVYMNSTGGSLGEYGANAEYTTASGDGNFTSTDPLYFPESDNVDFLAYYPYVEDVSLDASAYSVNVSSQVDLSAIDLMTASASNIENGSTNVYMDFTHKLSSIKFIISAGNGWDESDLVGLAVTLTGTDSYATYNLSTDAINLNGSIADITLNTATNGQSAEGIVIPQTLSGAGVTFTTASRGSFDLVINTAAFVEGVQYTYTVEIDIAGASLINSQINPWVEEAGTLGDIVEEKISIPSLSGSEYYPIILDDYTYEEIADRVVYDFRPNGVTNFLYLWDDTYTIATESGLNYYGNDHGYLALTVGNAGWAGCGYTVSGSTDAGVVWTAIQAAPEEYYLHMAMKSTSNYSHSFGVLATTIGVGPTLVYSATVMYDFTRDGEWHEIEVCMSELDLVDGFIPVTDDAFNVFTALTEGTYGADLNLDAVFIYKK